MKSWLIGKADDCDLVAPQQTVSSHHCRLTQDDAGFTLEDLQSTNGTFVNGRRLTGSRRVSPGDCITLGSETLMPWPDLDAASSGSSRDAESPVSESPVSESPVSESPVSESPVSESPVSESPDNAAGKTTVVSIGGAADNDVVLDYPMISGHHARLIMKGDEAVLEDLNSTNGTYIGSAENRISEARLSRDQTVLLGSYQISAIELLKRANISQDGTVDENQVVTQPLVEPLVEPQAADAEMVEAEVVEAEPVIGAVDASGSADGSYTTFRFQNKAIVFGRGSTCDQVLDHPMISRQHARVYRAGDTLVVEDLNSSNGTFINGIRIQEPTAVSTGDVISLGSYTFVLNDSGEFARRDYRGKFTLEARGVTIDVPDRTLISDVSLTMFPGEFAGLMGPSGAGKSTFMNAMNGYTAPSRGTVLINGVDLYRNYDQFRSQIGYVPQDDIVHEDLTVYQALYFTARLRLPTDFTNQEIDKRIATVVEQLGLQGSEHVRIGSPTQKGISGGQRKRVNLALELLSDPSILFLDEPTSGLSSEDALTVMRILRKLAGEGKTILLTIHQPSVEVYRLLDNLVLVAKDVGSTEPGKLAYFGPAHPQAISFFNPQLKVEENTSADLILRGLSQRPAAQWISHYEQSDLKRSFVDQRVGRHTAQNEASEARRINRVAGIRQWWTLLRRCMVVKRKDIWNTAILLAQAPIVAMLITLVFSKQANKEATAENWGDMSQAVCVSIFLMVLSAVWFGCSNSVREIVAEWAIYRRERMVNLKIPSYLFSKFTVLALLCAIQCFVLLGIVHWGIGMHVFWPAAYVVLLIAAMVGVGVGLIISSAVRSSEVAIASLPIVIIPMVILGGILQPIHEMNIVAGGLSQFLPSRWAFEALLVMEANSSRPKIKKQELMVGPKSAPPTSQSDEWDSDDGDSDDGDSKDKPEKVDVAEVFFPEEDQRWGSLVSVFVMLCMLTLMGVGTAVILRCRDIH